MLPYLAEFLGTMLLIILGDGVVANVNLTKSGMKGAGAVQITIAWSPQRKLAEDTHVPNDRRRLVA